MTDAMRRHPRPVQPTPRTERRQARRDTRNVASRARLMAALGRLCGRRTA